MVALYLLIFFFKLYFDSLFFLIPTIFGAGGFAFATASTFRNETELSQFMKFGLAGWAKCSHAAFY